MKKILTLAVVALLFGGTAMAQEQKTEKKKEGGFFKALKKGVESTTGLRVSDEALFVYPNLAEWKFIVNSCVGNLETKEVKIVLSCIKLPTEIGDEKNVYGILSQACITGTTKPLSIEKRSNDPLYSFITNQPTLLEFASVLDVPTDTKALDIKFYINYHNRIFEGRRIPIVWQ